MLTVHLTKNIEYVVLLFTVFAGWFICKVGTGQGVHIEAVSKQKKFAKP